MVIFEFSPDAPNVTSYFWTLTLTNERTMRTTQNRMPFEVYTSKYIFYAMYINVTNLDQRKK